MEVKRGGKRKGAGRKKADYKTKTMVEKMNNAKSMLGDNIKHIFIKK